MEEEDLALAIPQIDMLRAIAVPFPGLGSFSYFSSAFRLVRMLVAPGLSNDLSLARPCPSFAICGGGFSE